MDTFCVLPWYSREIFRNHTTSCCLLPADTDISQVKNDLLSNIKSTSCNKCWELEAQGLTSRRQQENEFLDYKLDRDLQQIKQDCIDGNNQVLVYQVVLSNLCNQACVTCQSAFSTKWSEIEIKQGLRPKTRHELDLNTANIDYASAKRINLLGGEPLFDPKTFEILECLVQAGNTDCFVSFVTNGSQLLTNRQLDLFAQFKDINICISIDGIGSRFEYMRWPGNWQNMLRNLEQYRSVAPNLSVSYTISALNACYYEETTEWFANNNLPYNHNVVSVPTWLSLEYMPVPLKKHFQHHKFLGRYCSINGQELELSFVLSQIASQDRAKNIAIKDYMPQVWDLLTSLS